MHTTFENVVDTFAPILSQIWRCLEPISFQKGNLRMGYYDSKCILTGEMPHNYSTTKDANNTVFSPWFLYPIKDTKMPITQGNRNPPWFQYQNFPPCQSTFMGSHEELRPCPSAKATSGLGRFSDPWKSNHLFFDGLVAEPPFF